MFYHGIHARRRSGEFIVLAAAFSLAPSEPPVEVVKQWAALRDDPRVGAEFSNLQRFLDNSIVERFELPHPDEAVAAQEKLAALQARHAHDERVGEARRLIARLEQLEHEGLQPEHLGLNDPAAARAEATEAQRKADEATEAQRKADEAAEAQRKAAEATEAQRKADEAAEAQRKADEANAAATNPPQDTSPGDDETHNLEEAGSTPAPATSPDSSEPSAPVPPETSLTGKKKNVKTP